MTIAKDASGFDAGLPPPATAAEIRVDAGRMCGPGGIVFGHGHRAGIFNPGSLVLRRCPDAWFDAAGTSPGLRRVLRAVAANEGGFDALNSWDSAVLSFGILQWSLGAGSASGELGGLLARVRQTEAEAFAEHFGCHELDVEAVSPRRGGIPRGYLVLAGQRLDSAQAKAALRTPLWAYRFWRAGHDARIARCQLAHAAARVETFLPQSRAALGGACAGDLLGSELGVALLFDEHVNRPSHVPGTLAAALAECRSRGLVPDEIARWDSRSETLLIANYLRLRHATTMTQSRDRATRIMAAAERGELGVARGSFTSVPR